MSDHPNECDHDKVTPAFDYEAAQHMSSAQVRQLYPRFYGECPDCRQMVTAYASFEHYVCGDW